MKLNNCLLFVLTSLVAAQLQITLDTIIFDIIQLDNAVKQLTSATAAYTGGLLLSQGIDFLTVQGKLNQANTDISLLPAQKLSVPEIQLLENVVSQTLAVDNPQAVNVLIAKKELIQKTPLQGGLVKTGLSSLLAGHLYFSKQALDRTPDSERANVQKLVDVISNALQKGIDSFSLL